MDDDAARAVQSAFDLLDPADFLPEHTGFNGAAPRGDAAILTARDASGLVLSAISDRAFLRRVVARLMPLRGRRVFEIGSGTGYLACALARLAGPEGRVEGCEVIPGLYEASRRNPRVTGAGNLRLHPGDFVEVLPRLGEFDVVLGTSSFSVLHPAVLDACSPRGGIVALPVEIPGGGDCLTFFRRHGDRLYATEAILSLSVPTTGGYSGRHFWAPPVDDVLPGWRAAARTVLALPRAPARPVHDTAAFRGWLLYQEPRFAAVNLGGERLTRADDMAFGLVSPDGASSCLQHGGSLVLQGPGAVELAEAFAALRNAWQAEGCPSLADRRYAIGLVPGQPFAFAPALWERVVPCT